MVASSVVILKPPAVTVRTPSVFCRPITLAEASADGACLVITVPLRSGALIAVVAEAPGGPGSVDAGATSPCSPPAQLERCSSYYTACSYEFDAYYL